MFIALTLITGGLFALLVLIILAKPVPGCTPYRGKSIAERELKDHSNKPKIDDSN